MAYKRPDAILPQRTGRAWSCFGERSPRARGVTARGSVLAVANAESVGDEFACRGPRGGSGAGPIRAACTCFQAREEEPDRARGLTAAMQRVARDFGPCGCERNRAPSWHCDEFGCMFHVPVLTPVYAASESSSGESLASQRAEGHGRRPGRCARGRRCSKCRR